MSAEFCALPFIQLQLQATGEVAPCCWNQAHVLGDARTSGIAEIWNGSKAQALRREFLEGKPVSCRKQIDQLQCHRYFEHLNEHVERAAAQKKLPRRLDLRLNGKCNLECVMCEVWKQPNGLYDRSDFWRIGPTDIFPHLLELNLLGGEPFVQKDTFRLIDEVSAVNQDCGWAFVTNGQWKLREPIRARLDRIRIRWIQVSLDSVNAETYPEIRKGGALATVLETIDALIEYRDRRKAAGRAFDLAASMCVQRRNWREVPQFLQYCFEKGLHPWFHALEEPAELSLLSLPRRELEEAYAFLGKFHSPRFSATLMHLLRPIEAKLAGRAPVISSELAY